MSDKVDFFHFSHDEEIFINAVAQSTVAIMRAWEKESDSIRRQAFQDAMVAVEGLLDEELAVDVLIQHKWPEEKPKEEKEYLIRASHVDANGKAVVEWDLATYYLDDGWASPCFTAQQITHWWERPEIFKEHEDLL